MSAWGTGWGISWGTSWGNLSGTYVVKVIISGSGSLEQPASVVSGAGFCGVQAKAAAGGGNFSRSRLPTPLDLVAEVRRDRLMESLGLRLVGSGVVEQPAACVDGAARIKRVSLVATGAVESGSGQVSATAVFRDVELEMVALLLAA